VTGHQALTQISLQGYPRFHSGKVRDTFDLDDRLLIVASDRISAFDVIMPNGIPGKGAALTKLSIFWFAQTSGIVANHFISDDLTTLPQLSASERAELSGRAMIVRRAQRIDFECVVRGYISGSAWKEYQSTGSVAFVPMPGGLRESDRLAEPIFTPAVKNDLGHDENISVTELRDRIGADLTAELERLSIALYTSAAAHAAERGIIIADTKFEFGFAGDDLIVIDEMLTPDSSRFWVAAAWEPGGPQESFDKQFLRDWLLASGWNREPPAPVLPEEIISGTRQRYEEAVARLTGPPVAHHVDRSRERAGV
jgi:phosphoribosylaminoimidazole-succinocarboxamide synthase